MARQVRSLLRSLAGGLPAKVGYNVSAYRYVLIGSDLLWWLPELAAGVPVVVMALNLEYRRVEEQTKGQGWICRREAARHRIFEGMGMQRAGRAVFVAADEYAEARRDWPDLQAITLTPRLRLSVRRPDAV